MLASPASPAGAALVVERVSKRFGARVQALQDASFALAPGELVLLSGPSGSGKSTLLNLLADEPTGALDTAAGVEVLELLDRLRRAHGTTVLLVSHQPEAAQHADRTIEICDGRILTPAPPPVAGA